MYASNEDEHNKEEEDWVFLHETPAANPVLHDAVNILDQGSSNSSSSSSSNSSRSSISSISSTELEHNDLINSIPVNIELLPSTINSEHVSLPLTTQNVASNCYDDDQMDKNSFETTTNTTVSGEDPFLFCRLSSTNNDVLPELQLISTPAVKEEISIPSSTANESHLLNVGFDMSKTLPLTNSSCESLSLPTFTNELRYRTGTNARQTEEPPPPPSSAAPERRQIPDRVRRYPNGRRLVLGILLGAFLMQYFYHRPGDQHTINNLTGEIEKLKQSSNIAIFAKDIEKKLVKQFEEKFHILINQHVAEQTAWRESEKFAFNLRLRELRQAFDLVQTNLTSTIDQFTEENGQLHEQVKVLEHRLQQTEKRYEKNCPEGVDCKQSSTPNLDDLLNGLLKQTATIAEDTTSNLSSLFENLSASISDVFDHRHEYVEESKRKLNDLVGSPTAEQVQMTLRRGVENLSSSLRKAKSTYATWLRSRAQRREQARNEADEQMQKQKSPTHPWRWTFQRGDERERMRHQQPVSPPPPPTSNHEHVCHKQRPKHHLKFPVDHFCSMKKWMEKFFRP